MTRSRVTAALPGCSASRPARSRRRSIAFPKPGSYQRHCVYHRFMEANVIVR
jgi:plastocyanin